MNDYTGTVLYVSHDRYFINQTATRILELVNHKFVNYIGNYDYYLEKKEELTSAYAALDEASGADLGLAGSGGKQSLAGAERSPGQRAETGKRPETY